MKLPLIVGLRLLLRSLHQDHAGIQNIIALLSDELPEPGVPISIKSFENNAVTLELARRR